MKVLGTAGTAEGEEVVKQAGASQVFNHRLDGYIQNILVLWYCHISGAPAALRAAGRSPISNPYMGNKRKPMS